MINKYLANGDYITIENFSNIMDIRDEYGNSIDIANIEKHEQDLADQYILEDDIVLELGTRYGSAYHV